MTERASKVLRYSVFCLDFVCVCVCVQVDAKKLADLGGSGIDSVLQRAMANRKSMFDRT